MADLKVNVAGVEFATPIIAASGTFGFGPEYEGWVDLHKVGGLAMKGLTVRKKLGNPPVRIVETASGILNSVGLQNPGVVDFLKDVYPKVKDLPTRIIANVAGGCEEDYVAVVVALEDTDIDMCEINVSCPNVAAGGMSIGVDPSAVFALISAVRKATTKPLIVKLTPNVTNIVAPAKAAVEAGADALSLINTLTGMAIDPRTRRPILSGITGGLSGPAIKPVALRMVYQLHNANLGVPLIGIGGIMTGEDAAEFMIAGASAVMVGTATVHSPEAAVRIADELNAFADEQGIEKVSDLTGSIKVGDESC